MEKITFRLLLFFLAFLVAPSLAFCQSTATYTITFNSTWNGLDHNNNTALPGNAHYSKLVGAVHNSNIAYWEPGQQASAGIEDIAEIGNNTSFFNQVQNSITAGNTQQYIDDNDLTSATGIITVRIMDVSEAYPLITLASMIAPSSDWFVGVHNLSLIDSNGNWKDMITLDMFVYDAGTENDDISYSFDNAATNPQSVITSKNDVDPFNNVRVGTLTITLDTNLGVTDNSFTKVQLFPNPTRGLLTVKTSNSTILDQALVYDILGKQVTNFQNSSSDNEFRMNLTNLKNGVYLVKLVLKDGSQSTKKVIIN